jgi:hypothetical protein
MQSSTSVCCALIPSGDHVVDWQLARSADTAAGRGSEIRDLRERIKALEGRAMTLLREVVADPRAQGGRRTLYALNAEIAALRAELAWRKVAEPLNANPR